MSNRAEGQAPTGARIEKKHPSYGWVVVAITFLCMGLVLGSRFSFGLFLPYLPGSLNASTSAVAGAFAISMLGAAAFQPFTGYLLDRFGGKFVLSVGLAFAGVALCGTALSNSLWQFVLLMGLATSVGYAAVSPASVTSVVAHWFTTNRGTALGIATSGTKVSMIVLPPAIAALILIHDWRTAMFAVGLLVLVMIVPVLAFIRPAPPASASGDPAGAANYGKTVQAADDITIGAALTIPAFWLLAITLFSNGLTMNLVFVHLPAFVMSRGFATAEAATGLAVLGGIGIFGNMITGWMSDGFGRHTVLLIMFGARGIATFLVLMWPGTFSFITFVVIFGLLGYGAIGVIGSLAADLFGRRAIGTILGTAYLFNQVGGAVGAFAGGAALEWTGGFDAALWLSLVTIALSLPCIALLGRATSKKTRP